MGAPPTDDEITAQLDAWIAANPTRPLKPWEQRALDGAFDVPDWMQIRATWSRDFKEDY